MTSQEALLSLLLEAEGVRVAPPQIIGRSARPAQLPLSFAQQRLWFLDRLEPENAAYHIAIAFQLEGQLDGASLQKSLDALVRRHEVLRTNFIAREGQPVQQIAPLPRVNVALVDLQYLAVKNRDADVQRLLTAESRKPFALARDALLRVLLVKLGETTHILLATMHHIIADGWSIHILIRELSLLYQAFLAGHAIPLPELPIQYVDFAVWQREWLQGAVFETQLTYWQRQLAGIPALSTFPPDRPRPAVQTYQGRTVRFEIPAELTRRLKTLSQHAEATLFSTLLAAFATLLGRYSGQEDLVIGTPVANRTYQELEPLIGFFVNTLALRIELSGNPTFRELLRQVRHVTLAAQDHQAVPFEKLVEALHPERNRSYAPVFQVMFALQNVPPAVLALPGVTAQPVALETGTAKFDVTLLLTETERGLAGTLEYSTELFEAATMSRLAGHYQRLLEGIAANPQQRLAALPLLSASERIRVLSMGKPAAATYVPDTCLHAQFEQQAALTPDAVAVACDEQQRTYRQLNEQANQVAHYLRSVGVGPESRVGLYCNRFCELVVGLLGILKAGGAYIPIDPVYPPDRIAFMLADGGAAAVLTGQTLQNNLPSRLAIPVLCLDAKGPELARQPRHNPRNRTLPNQPAYLIYTSGSTGQPKGVIVTHDNVIRLFRATQDWYHFDAHDVWTLFHSLAFDFSVWEIWGAFLHGGRLVIVPYLTSRSPEAFYELLHQARVTILNQTPSAFRQLIAAEARGGVKPLALRWVILGGEALELPSLQPWFERHGDQSPQLVNMYGITETTVHVTYRPITQADVSNPASVIGAPIPDLQIYLLDQHSEPVPLGVAGEMYVGGAGVARGYLGRPDLTAERMLPDPFSAAPGARLYKTGDLARYRANGDLEYLGRSDQQVKIRGFRIELGEIEAILAMHPAIREVVVIVRADAPGQPQLVAYLVPQQTPPPSVSDLRRFLHARVPEYMIPAVFVLLTALPLTRNGKVDRRVLPLPEGSRPHLAQAYQTPGNAAEEALAEIWAELLGIEQVGRRDNFFELGGHSLLAIGLMHRIHRRFGQELPLASLFEEATIEHLAERLSQPPATFAPASLVKMQPAGARQPFFCVHPGGGSVLCYAQLAGLLGAEQPFYALQARGLDGKHPPDDSIEAMAAFYLTLVREVQPEGPYCLGGFSIGGVIAFEMAQQLRQRQQLVNLLALLDTWVPNPDARLGKLARQNEDGELFLEFVKQNLGGMLPVTLPVSGDALRQLPLEEQFAQVFAQLKQFHLLPKDEEVDGLRRLFGVFKAIVRANAGYRPQVYPGRLCFFQASEPWQAGAAFPAQGWRSFATQAFEVYSVPGNHFTMLTLPHVQVLAKQLNACLASVS